tara:strand:- start:2033 stop:2257 length:225 start_codon:yes stop_codon:yes gene_type:complete
MIKKKGYSINGRFFQISDKCDANLQDLLQNYLKEKFSQRCAISLNKKLVPRNQWKVTNIKENDKIEVVFPFKGG